MTQRDINAALVDYWGRFDKADSDRHDRDDLVEQSLADASPDELAAELIDRLACGDHISADVLKRLIGSCIMHREIDW